MDSARWARARSILECAIDLNGPDLEAHLAHECGQDSDLRQEVESLLGSQAHGSAIEPPAVTDLARAIGDPNLGRRIGPYVVERLIGSGGMGVVYLARRVDADFEQRVALKLIKRGMGTDDILRQFRRERAVLAGLEHPSIARLFDGGSTDDGLPWLAMEYIEGRPIDSWCEEHALSTRARIELFITVCSAVRHAHQRLIVHRDLKPSNILVGKDGTPKLLDFGIAKMLATDGAQATANTLAGQQCLTPDYASPEQLRGEGVSTATDVYSLGVILYELLTGANPFHGVMSPERDTPARPSTRVANIDRNASMARRRRDLRGDLDTITLTALALETRQRYASVEALELDLRRHLDGLPIEARPATAAYRARKFVRRNRVAVAALAAIFASLVIGLLFARAGYLAAIEQRGLAEQRRLVAEKEARRANSVLKLTHDMLGSASPHDVKSKDYTLRELLDEFDARLDTQTAVEPEVEASVRQIMGRAYRELGMIDKAKRHLDRALELTPGALTSNDETSIGLLRDWLNLLHDHGDFAHAESECTKIISRIESSDAVNAAKLRVMRGDCRWHLDRFDEAEADLRAALLVLNASQPISYDDVLLCMSSLMTTLDSKGALEEAQTIGTDVLDLARKHTGNRSMTTSTILNNLGFIALRRGELALAEAELRESLAIEREVRASPDPGLAPTLANLGRVLTVKGNYTEAESVLREAVALSRTGNGERHPNQATDLSSLGAVLQSKGDYAGAESAMRESLEIRFGLNGEENLEVARSMNNLAVLLRYRGKNEESETMLRKALAVRRKLLGPHDAAVAATLANLSGSLLAHGDLAGAETAAREAVSIYREAPGPARADLAASLASLSAVRLRQADFAEARSLVEEALALRRKLFGPEHPDIARSLSNLGEVLIGAGDLDAAKERLSEAEAMQRKLIGAAHPNLARTLYLQGDLAERTGRASDAQVFMREALTIRRKALGDANNDTRDAATRLARMLDASGDADGARSLRQELGIAQADGGHE